MRLIQKHTTSLHNRLNMINGLLLGQTRFLATVAKKHPLFIGSTFENVHHRLKCICAKVHAFIIK